MKNFKIFTESKADVRFLQDAIKTMFDIILVDNDFDTLGSWSGYKAGGNIKTSIQENFDNSKTSILIIDADTDFSQRRAEVEDDFNHFGIPIKLFLFPDNKSNGALESLLIRIAVETKIVQCFEMYESCISEYQSPVLKSKVFAYLDALLPAGNKKGDKNDLIQEKNRNYRIPEFWDLHDESLQELRTFLQDACQFA